MRDLEFQIRQQMAAGESEETIHELVQKWTQREKHLLVAFEQWRGDVYLSIAANGALHTMNLVVKRRVLVSENARSAA